ncbi:hypothetical protein BDN71DRAFT_363638 [Pleurotus eryngii]|uniref:DUF6533 domain-containing protein n=1 Tax=Pleurotus eryngii TaxID=5323 RepID=A0A9P5ZJX0_PLEER|nr:hypothetical protein BDN71DRAFT_363638 [Pleurotus eryngii]
MYRPTCGESLRTVLPCLTWILHDHFLTIEDEVRYIWVGWPRYTALYVLASRKFSQRLRDDTFRNPYSYGFDIIQGSCWCSTPSKSISLLRPGITFDIAFVDNALHLWPDSEPTAYTSVAWQSTL